MRLLFVAQEVGETPIGVFTILKELCKNWTAKDQIFLLGKYSAKERLLQFFLNISSQREKLGWGGNPIRLSMPRADIANYLGLTIETVSRTISELKKEQLIKMIGTHDIFLHNKNSIQNFLSA